MLSLPDSIYQKYEDVVQKCRVRSTSIAPPPRAKIRGIRASNFGDVIFVDHAEIGMRKNKYVILLVLDGSTNLLWATAQSSLNNKDTIRCPRMWSDENNCMPKVIVGDEAFFQDDFLTYYRTHGIKECPCGARTPWPNRAETAVRLFKRVLLGEDHLIFSMFECRSFARRSNDARLAESGLEGASRSQTISRFEKRYGQENDAFRWSI